MFSMITTKIMDELETDKTLTAVDFRLFLALTRRSDDAGFVEITSAQLATIIKCTPAVASRSLTKMHRDKQLIRKIRDGVYRIQPHAIIPVNEASRWPDADREEPQ
jgi:hypothetical protein